MTGLKQLRFVYFTCDHCDREVELDELTELWIHVDTQLCPCDEKKMDTYAYPNIKELDENRN